jgi:hypothetical protein
MRLLPVLALFAPALAHAGGIGVMGSLGERTETVYYYDSSSNNAQFRQPQIIPHFGAGLEFVLGDRDDHITGLARAYWIQEGPEHDPSKNSSIDPGSIVANWREKPRNVGIATFGVNWGFLGDPNEWQLSVISEMGAGFITGDHTDFLLLQGGPSFQYMVGPSLQVHADLTYGMRVRKQVQHGGNAYVGVRWLFD